MRYQLQLTLPIAGFASRAGRVGEANVPYVSQEFLSSDDGILLVHRLEEMSKVFLELAPEKVSPSEIDHLIIIVGQNLQADIFINEPNLVAQVQALEDVTAGDPARIDTFADVLELSVGEVKIPDDAGYFALFSVGWRKGLVYDFSQLVPGAVRAPRNVPKALGAAFSYVLYQERFSLTEDEWEQLLVQRWFPFIGLTDETVLVMIKHLRAGWPVDELLPDIAEELHAGLPKLRAQVAASSVVAGHAAVVSSALDALERGEWLTVSALLLPRLEGVLRSHYARLGKTGPNPKSLTETAVEDRFGRRHEHSLIFPARFKTYLEKTFFAAEDFSDPTAVAHVTRHSTAHGVAPESKLDRKQAVLSILILRQLMILLAI